MSKYYAVKVGKSPGIYNSWDACKQNVNGFSGAIYKSFKSIKEAENFIGLNKELNQLKEIIDLRDDYNSGNLKKLKYNRILDQEDNIIEFFTDGSHSKHENNGYIGFGIFCSYLGKEYEYSGHCDSEKLKEYGIENSKISNPTSEFIGFAETLKMLKNKNFRNNYTFIFKIDYEGVEKWMNGNWKCKEIYIQKIKAQCVEYLSHINAKIKFEHVPGHSNVYGNEKADKLAKCRENIDTLSSFLETL